MPRMSHPNELARVFFALWPKPAEREALAAWQADLCQLCGGQVMRADTLHGTLVFLGEVATDRLETLKLAAQEVMIRTFELNFDTARYWGHNHIAYATPSHIPHQLEQLVTDLEHSLDRHHFRFEHRPYQPHVTLLRHAMWTDAALPDMPRAKWQVSDFVLVQSLRDKQDAQYQVLARFAASELE